MREPDRGAQCSPNGPLAPSTDEAENRANCKGEMLINPAPEPRINLELKNDTLITETLPKPLSS